MNRNPFPRLIFVVAFILAVGCNLPRLGAAEPTPTPVLGIVTETFTPPPSSAELGTPENPLILALSPSASSQEAIESANLIASQLKERTGYTVVTILPDSEMALVEAFQKGNAHIALLDPYAYALAYQNETVKAAYAVLKDGKSQYGAQFLAQRRAGFTPFFNPVSETNADDNPAIALVQFNDRKPCWSDERSLSGYVIPSGYLKSIGVTTKPAAFVEGHPTVVRSLYADGICEFGATYIDARKFPSLEDQFPDLMEQVIVIWRIPEIIPYDIFVFSSAMPQPMRDLFASAIPVIMQTTDGNSAFKTVYDIDELEQVNDGFFAEFRALVDASDVNLASLLK
ncbi:MAG TPA: PhnD/SsuA/transferrin family substrate-binding protein [Anaerolineales bacterium]|nr:PhnD/SsuA/transferrin family substrate-binding protein [Anaerolineales bacterium]